MLEAIPVIPGDDTVFKVFKEKKEYWLAEKVAPHTMSSKAMRAIFDNLTSGAGRRAEQEYNTDSDTNHKADSIELNVKSVRLSTQMHVTGPNSNVRTQRLKQPRTGVTLIKRNQSHGQSN